MCRSQRPYCKVALLTNDEVVRGSLHEDVRIVECHLSCWTPLLCNFGHISDCWNGYRQVSLRASNKVDWSTSVQKDVRALTLLSSIWQVALR